MNDRAPAGARRFAICLALRSMFAGLTARCTNATQLFTLRVLLGAGEAVNTPAGMRWVRLNFPARQHGFAMGLYQAAAKAGPAIGAPLIVWLLLGIASYLFLVRRKYALEI